MKVFLDTNVLASAFATRGLCFDVLGEVGTSHVLLTSDLVLEELARALRDKFEFPSDLVADDLRLVRQKAAIVQPGVPPLVRPGDNSDVTILAAAVAGKADLFVTGDKELLDIGRVGDLEIISPRQLWERMAGK